ncbi:MAG: cell division protein FtsL [Candidatus Malihini olakiniferum]
MQDDYQNDIKRHSRVERIAMKKLHIGHVDPAQESIVVKVILIEHERISIHLA